MNKILLIGIDAFDSILLDRFITDLPNLQKFLKNGKKIDLQSVSPPDSNSAWATIYTGKNPAKHGIVHFCDPLDKIQEVISGEFDTKSITHNTFWDLAGKKGKKTDILLPHLCYPAWPIHGIMVCRSMIKIDAEIDCYPESVKNSYDLSGLQPLPGFAGAKKNFNEFIHLGKNLINKEFGLAENIIVNEEWDLFFVYSSVLDTICHNFWSYTDEKDPAYKKNNEYENIIKFFYQLYDRKIGELLSKVDDETIIIIFSDHGHGLRPIRLFNVNEFLRLKGFLTQKSKKFKTISLIESIKSSVITIISKYNLGKIAVKILKILPISRKLYTYPLTIDLEKSQAYLLDLSGLKAYSYGGIKINRENLDSDFGDFCNKLIKELYEIKDPETEKPIFLWIKKREDLYKGEFINKYPDIVFQLTETIGAGNSINKSLFSDSNSHNLVPGSHKMYSATFIINHPEKFKFLRSELKLEDIAPTVLKILNVELERVFDGTSLVEVEN